MAVFGKTGAMRGTAAFELRLGNHATQLLAWAADEIIHGTHHSAF